MEKHYNMKWLSSLYRGMLLTFSLLFVSGMAMAQLDGAYTIDSSKTTSGTNFQSFTAFNAALAASGVKGPIVVTVAPSSGPYNENVVINAVSGASATNTITIKGNMNTVTRTSTGPVFRLDGADWITFDSLIVQASGTGNGTSCFHLKNQADNNTITNCQLIVDKNTGTSTFSNAAGYIVFSEDNSRIRNRGANHGNYNTISNNHMSHGTATGNQGPYYGIVDYRPRSGTRGDGANVIDNNVIMDCYYAGIYKYYCGDGVVTNNTITRPRGNARTFFGIYDYYAQTNVNAPKINNNNIYNCTTQGTMYGIYGGRMEGGTDNGEINNNKIIKCGSSTGTSYGLRFDYVDGVDVLDNQIDSNTGGGSYGSYYAMYGYYAQNVFVSRNHAANNSATNYMYDLQIPYSSGEYTNNILVNNVGERGHYGIFGGYGSTGKLTIAHNTLEVSTKAQYDMYAVYAYYFGTGATDFNFVNNIVDMSGYGGFGTYFVYAPRNFNQLNIENNDFYNRVPTGRTVQYGTTNSLAAMNNALNTTSNIDVDPKFVNLAKTDVTPTNPVISNYGLSGYETVDFNKVTRTACGPDIGGLEFFIDHNATNLVFSANGTTQCGGYTEPIKFTYNNGANIDLIGAEAFYTINKGTPGEKTVVEAIDTIPANGSNTYTFMTDPVFNEPGTVTVEVGILCDDSAANNVLTASLTIVPSPHSFEFAQGTTFGGYYEAGTMNKPDVTASGVQIDYDIMNPAKYANVRYDSDWKATVGAMTDNGTDVSGITSLTKPGSAMGIVSVNPVDSLQDSLIYVYTTVTDINTGCDSTFGRWLYVPHTPVVDFIAPDGCDGEVVAFVNETEQETGVTEYMWDFGDPASGTENNMSTISDPIHAFSTYGNFDVKLTAWNFDYPKFKYELTKTVQISPVPTVDFKVTNACEGNDISFTNNTSLPAGITGTIDYNWSFGDGATSTMKDPTHQYAAAGGYQVTLTASLRGCATSLTKNANQFATPDADFSVAGNCNLEDVKFTNASTIAIGNTGYKWDFQDGSISNLMNPTHAFATPGSKTVVLKAISEFGCEDEVQKSFTLEESPKADFDFTDPCSETDVEFTRTGSLPSGASSIFEWDFDGERISTRENDKHRFATVGVKTVSLTVSSDNGCSDMISKEFVVKLQAKADFVANDVCEGEDVVFTNSSDVARGSLEYEWRFGGADADGNTTSSLTSPRHNYQLLEAGVTESFRVTLLAIVPDGCSDSIAKTVTVNAKSDASFDAEVNWRNLVISNQATTDPTNTYNWRFGDGGRSSDVTPSYKYSDDEATYQVCLAIINNAGCISEHCEDVELDIATSGINDIAANDVFSVYPNPNTGKFNVKVNDPQSNLSIVILDATGKTIKTVETTAHEVYSVDISDVAAGVYMVQVVNGNYSAMQRVTVAK